MHTKRPFFALTALLLSACSGAVAPSWTFATAPVAVASTDVPTATASPTTPSPTAPSTPTPAPTLAPTPSPSSTPIAAARATTATLTEFKIALGTTTLAAGSDVFSVTNAGTIGHEFVIRKTDLADDALPRKDDGTIDEEASELVDVGEVEIPKVATTKELKVVLTAGHYVFFCNIAGHYAGGMHGSFTVVATG